MKADESMSRRNHIAPVTRRECLLKALSPFWPSCQFLQPTPGTWIKDFRLSKTSSRSFFGRAYTPQCMPACQQRWPARSTWTTRVTHSTRTSQSTWVRWSSNFLKSTYQDYCIVVSKGENKEWMIGKRFRKRWVWKIYLLRSFIFVSMAIIGAERRSHCKSFWLYCIEWNRIEKLIPQVLNRLAWIKADLKTAIATRLSKTAMIKSIKKAAPLSHRSSPPI